MLKERLAKLIDTKSIVTLTLTVAMVLLLVGVFNPPKEVLALFSMSYGAVITYFFTKEKKEG
jgi:hypothetical protein